MKLMKGALILILIGILWSTSELIKTYRLNQLVALGKIPYGPLPDVSRDFYSYNGLHAAFDSSLNLKRSEEFTKKEFEDFILKSLDLNARENFKKYLPITLNFSEDYQIDPFWIISIMMVESGFDFKAQSQKNARGLMQIQPDTAEHLYSLMRKKISSEQIYLNLHHPTENIEMGVFYLKKLLQNFRFNYKFATIAYNVGPNKLRELLLFDDFDTANFSYFIKVQESYKDLIKNFSAELKKRPRPYEVTYVVREQGRLLLEDHLLELYVDSFAFLKPNFLIGSENLKRNRTHSLTF